MSLIGKNVGNYRVIAKIGEGGMGSVYLGEHPMIGKRVAIKTLHPDLATKDDIVSRFFTEAKAVNDIGHPNIVDIVDFGKMRDHEQGGAEVVYFIMEYLDGEGLNSRLKREGVSPREALHILRQCCSALAASHRKHIVHRDLKPENIYLVTRADDRNYVKLLDFGIAKLTGSESSISQHKTRTGLVIGTPAYMSPEQCEGRGNVDWRSDVYSLGVVMYEMLTGRVPFPGEGFGEVLVAHLTKYPELPSALRTDVPASLESIVMHAMEKDKNRRFQSMEEFIAAIDDPGAHMGRYGSPSGRSDSTAAGTVQMAVATPQDLAGGARSGTGPQRSPSNPGATVARVPTGQGPRVSTGEGPRPTTLSGSSGELADEPAPGKSRAPLYAAVAAVVVVVAGGGGYLLKRGADQGAAREAAARQAAEQSRLAAGQASVGGAAAVPESVHITVDSSPRGARIFRAGVADSIGATPFTLAARRAEPDFDVLVKLDGYKDETRTISTQRDYQVLIALAKVEAPLLPSPDTAARPAASSTTTAAAGSSSSSSGHRSSHDKRKGGKTKVGGSDSADDVLAPSF